LLVGGDVLVVEDDDDLRGAVAGAVALAGYEVREGRDGAEALRLMRDRIPGLVITDLWMPNLDGWQLLGVMRGDSVLSTVPVLIITAAPNVPSVPDGVPIFTKPLRFDNLIAAVKARLGSPT
jgi:DNA-binding response OmpR family regulator